MGLNGWLMFREWHEWMVEGVRAHVIVIAIVRTCLCNVLHKIVYVCVMQIDDGNGIGMHVGSGVANRAYT